MVPRVLELGEAKYALWAELEQDDETEHSKGYNLAIHAMNELNFHFRSRRTKPPTYAYTVMRSNLWGGKS